MNSARFAVSKAQQASGETAVERDAEIAQLKRELEILQARYARYRRSAQMLKGFCLAFVPGLALVLAIKLFLFDTLYSLFFVGAVLLYVAVISRFDDRWIDVVSYFGFHSILLGPDVYNPYFYYPNVRPRPCSDAELLEWQIGDRERRLSELGESVPGLKTD
ncbi:MAG: hypothetical protein WAL80_16755 [Xanthobacteraceae bacterium]|jgi:hypothetical protein